MAAIYLVSYVPGGVLQIHLLTSCPDPVRHDAVSRKTVSPAGIGCVNQDDIANKVISALDYVHTANFTALASHASHLHM
jgi:hypothetical protein